jgi:hypothetical protein
VCCINSHKANYRFSTREDIIIEFNSLLLFIIIIIIIMMM